jgi:hypothetical protein
MSGILSDDVESYEAASFRAMRPPYVFTSTSSDDPPLLKATRRHSFPLGEPWTNATGVLFAVETVAELAAGEVASEDFELEHVHADTAQPRTGEVLARLLDAVSRPTQQDSAPIAFDPDDYPLF